MRRRGGGLALAALAALLAGCWSLDSSFPPLSRHRIDYANHGTYFPIDADAIHARPDCELCHGGYPSFREFTCLRCHEHDAAVVDPFHANVDGYVYDSTSCYGCHPQGTAAPVDHGQFFPIGPGTPHTVQHCSDCHPNPLDRSVYDCIDCHDHRAEVTDPAHAGVAGYRFASDACLACHPRGAAMTRAEHDRFFPILTGPHALACSDCHTQPGVYTAFECILCHTHDCGQETGRHSEVAGFSCVSSECYRCHPRGQAGN